MAEPDSYILEEVFEDDNSTYSTIEESSYSLDKNSAADSASLPNLGSKSISDRYSDGLGALATGPRQSAAQLSASETRNWNTEFQLLLERPNRTPEDAKERIELIGNLFASFTTAAVPLAKVLVAEEDLPLSAKSIAPVNVGMSFLRTSAVA